ncbi:VanZ like family protein [Haloferax mucosum ATCC BAA-1512]|uniref:VanZ like family protein n=1 Tax=Haloferax mucosum ATCC BAA-1512 TaxID=662479 RepID=M0IGA9_9EURY|nr:VanZ like family protein [Haloferax mucosum]ELZ94479.1 VanZ like family protein [Haloferax mucosum ATCC BAA-1512]
MHNRFSTSRWTPVAIGTAVLFVASVVPSPFKRHSGWRRFGPDKFLHFVGHAGYATALANALGTDGSDGRAAVLAVCLSTAHSLVTGRVQTRVPGREFELADVGASLLGAVLAACGWYAVRNTLSNDPNVVPEESRMQTAVR